MVVSFKLAYGQTILRYLSKVNENRGSERVLYMNSYISFIHSNSNWKQPTVLQQVGKNYCIYTSNGLLLMKKKYIIDTHNNMKDLESIVLGKTYQTPLCTVIREN